MIEDKETLRKEFEDRFTYEVTGGRWVCTGTGIPNKLFEWIYTKLKNQAEESDKRYNALKVAFDDMYKKADEYYESNKQLKAELSRKEEILTQEKAKAFDEGSQERMNIVIDTVEKSGGTISGFYLENCSKEPVNPYRQDK